MSLLVSAHRSRIAALATCLALAAVALPASAAPGPVTQGDVLDTPLEPLAPKADRTEDDRDRLEAMSLFAAARTLEQREDQPAALRLYQRAFRHDPASAVVLAQIVSLAVALERSAEAMRYAVLAPDRAPDDPLVLRQVALHLADDEKFAQAVAVYERAINSPDIDRDAAGFLFMTAELAQIYEQAGQHDRAAASYRELQDGLEKKKGALREKRIRQPLLEALGGEEGAYQAFGDAYLAAGRLDDAAAAFEKRHELAEDAALLGYNLARVELARDNAAAAEEQLNKYLTAHSAEVGLDAYKLLGQILDKQGRGGEFLARLEALVGEDEGNAALAYFLAERYRESGQLDKIEGVLAYSLEEGPPLEIYQALVSLHVEQKNAGKLLEVLGACAADGETLDPLREDIESLAEKAELVDGLIAEARKRLESGPGALPFGQRLAVAQVALAAGRLEPAKEFFELALAEKQDSLHELLVSWGADLIGADVASDAVAALRRALEELPPDEPKPAVALFYLSTALELAGQTDEALEIAREAARRADKNPRQAPLIYSRIGWIAYHADRYDVAEDSYRQLIALYDQDRNSEDTREVLRDTRLALSNLAVIRGDLPAAEEWLEQVLDEYPDDVSAQNDLGYLWADQGKHLHRALRMIRRAVADQPDNLAYRDSLGWVLFRLGRHAEALAELQRAASGEDPDAVILDHLGDALLATGDLPQARAAWQRALEGFDPAAEGKLIEATRRKLAEHPAGEATGDTQAAKPPDAPPQK